MEQMGPVSRQGPPWEIGATRIGDTGVCEGCMLGTVVPTLWVQLAPPWGGDKVG